MPVRTYNPTSPGRRFQTVQTFDEITTQEPYKPLTEPLKKSGVFPPMVVSMINVGEQTGGLDEMLTKIADFYDEEVDAAVSGLLGSHGLQDAQRVVRDGAARTEGSGRYDIERVADNVGDNEADDACGCADARHAAALQQVDMRTNGIQLANVGAGEHKRPDDIGVLLDRHSGNAAVAGALGYLLTGWLAYLVIGPGKAWPWGSTSSILNRAMILALVHDRTGERRYRDGAVDGMERSESDRLLNAVWDHAERPEFVYEHRWQPGDFVIWDDRATLHAATANYAENEKRLLYRTMLRGGPTH